MLRLAAVAAAMALGWATLELRSLMTMETAATAVPVAAAQGRAGERAPGGAGARGLGKRPEAGHGGGARATRPATAPATARGDGGPRDAAACPAAGVDLEGGAPRTARALAAGLARHGLDGRGRTWLGPLAAVGGGRDTLVHVPATLDPARRVELVVYLEGHGSFDDVAMERRHAAAIARLVERVDNVAYVAPDAPSSAHGDPTARTAYWQAGCGDRACAGGHAAPGDFVAFLDQARARVAALACVDGAALEVRLHLVGFSNGGKGVWQAVRAIADAEAAAGRPRVILGDVVFADGNYGARWLADTWARLASRPEAPRLTVLVTDGSFTSGARAAGNRHRAAAFWRAAVPDGAAPAAGRAVSTPRLRLHPLRGGHHAVGDAAVDFVLGDGAPRP